MSDGTSIEWADASWQPVVGCTRVSAGCDNCYAINTVHRFRKADGLTKLRPKTASRPGLDWSGKVALQPERLADPLKWRKPRRVFVCSQADLFHDAVPFEFIAAVFGVMAACPQHTFLVLTKRPERARAFFDHTFGLESCAETVAWKGERHGVIWDSRGSEAFRYPPHTPLNLANRRAFAWPLPNVHLGTSVEDQATADARIPALLECPAALHWVSAEPLLGPVDMRGYLDRHFRCGHSWDESTSNCSGDAHVRWIVVGGESGPRARPFFIEWARSIVGQCRGASVLAFVKQLGSRPHYEDGRHHDPLQLADYSGGDMAEWPADLRVREWAR